MAVGFADFKAKITRQSFRLMCDVGPLAGTVPLERGCTLRCQIAVQANSDEAVKSDPATRWYPVCQCPWEFCRSPVDR